MSRSRNAAFRNYANEFAHIEDPNEQRRLILEAIDNAPLGWSQIRAAVVAGIGFLTDSYDIFAISLISDMLGFVYFKDGGNFGRIPERDDTRIKVSTSVGIVIGQLLFGWLADVVGRKRMYGLELVIIILATLGHSLSSSSSAISITALLMFWRFIMGIGLGGDYPLSGVITAEFATTRWRGAMIAAVFAMQGFGQLIASLVAYIATACFKSVLDTEANYCEKKVCHSDLSGSASTDRLWRIIIGFGAIPAALALYFRLTIPETPRYTFDIERDVEQAYADTLAWMDDEIGPFANQGQISAEREERRAHLRAQNDGGLGDVPKGSWREFFQYYGKWKRGKVLLGTAGAWFCLDVAFYGVSLNNPIILRKISKSFVPVDHSSATIYKIFQHNALGNLILVCAGAIPGYLVTVFTVDRIGRKFIQILGFTVLTIIFIILGFGFNKIPDTWKLILYVFCQFFFNFGPNATTFIVPAEAFPTRYRSTSHGISSAAGKLGAIVAQTLIGPLRVKGIPRNEYDDSPWLDHVMQIFSAFMLAGLLLSFLIPETKGKTLEELSATNEEKD